MNEVRKLKRSHDSNHPNESDSKKHSHKRPRIHPIGPDYNVLSVADIYKQVRGCMRRWINKQDDDCCNLQEGDDFSINVDSNTRTREFDVSIRCL